MPNAPVEKTKEADLTARTAELRAAMPADDGRFFTDMLQGVLYTTCNGVRLSGPEKDRQEWKIPAHEVMRLVRILSALGENERRKALDLLSEAEEFGKMLANEALAVDIHTFLFALSDAKHIFPRR